jgi:hypothetical protein
MNLDSCCHLPKHSYIYGPKSLGDEPQYSIHNLGIEESYGFGVLNEGQAIAVAKNVKVRQNEMSTPARPIIWVGPDNTNFQLPSALVGAAPFDVNNDNYDLATVGFVS